MKLLILSALIVITLNAKDRNWEPGKVIDQEVTTRYAGQAGPGHPTHIVTQTVVIAGDDYSAPLGRFYQEYIAQRQLHVRSQTAALIVNTPVKFAVEKRKLYLVDDDGNKYGFDIVKQVQREAK